MSSFEQIFFDAPYPLDVAGLRAAEVMGLHGTPGEREVGLYATPATSGLLAAIGGSVEPNIYAETDPQGPSEISIFDDMPYVAEVRVPKEHFELQAATALAIYRRLVDALHWRSALTSEYATLVASYDDVHGYREFPPDTLSDGTHADRWR